MSLKSFIVHSVAFVVVSGGAALAQDRANRFHERDQNGDRVLSEGEYTSTGGHPGNFRALDANGDGVLSRNEFVNRIGIEDDAVLASSAVRDQFHAKDRNGDGFLTRAEYGDPATFRRVDRNDDRRITFEEFADPAPPATAREEFSVLDRNRDGVLSRTEWTGSATTFRRLDRNRDGRLTRGEFGS
jgi:hypothetical protein